GDGCRRSRRAGRTRLRRLRRGRAGGADGGGAALRPCRGGGGEPSRGAGRGVRGRRAARGRRCRADLGRPGVGALPPRADPGRRQARSRAGVRTGTAMTHPLALTGNGVAYSIAVDGARTLLSTLRDELGLTGAKEGCDDSECGACMVLIDGRPVNACSFLALQADGRTVTTVEGLGRGAEPGPLQRAFVERGGIQCG